MLGLPRLLDPGERGPHRRPLRNCGYAFGRDRRITVSMAPASSAQDGLVLRPATAVGLLAADGAPAESLARAARGRAGPTEPCGPCRGSFHDDAARAWACARRSWRPTTRPRRPRRRRGVYPVRSLAEAVGLAGPPSGPLLPCYLPAPARTAPDPRRAIVDGPAGWRSRRRRPQLLLWPARLGKTMLARRLPGSASSRPRSAGTTAIHSAGDRLEGLWPSGRSAHPITASDAPRGRRHSRGPASEPGLKTAPLPRRAPGVPLPRARSLRQPLEDREVCRRGAGARVAARPLPAPVATMNPCRAGPGTSGGAAPARPEGRRVPGPHLGPAARPDRITPGPRPAYADMAGRPERRRHRGRARGGRRARQSARPRRRARSPTPTRRRRLIRGAARRRRPPASRRAMDQLGSPDGRTIASCAWPGRSPTWTAARR